MGTPIRHGTTAVVLAALFSLPVWAQTAAAPPQATTVSALSPSAVAYDGNGNLYVASRAEHVVRMVNALGQVTLVAGTGEQGFLGDGGPAIAADLDSPSGVAVDASGTVYIADSHNNRIRAVKNGTITTIAGSGVAGYAGDQGNATAAALDGPTAISVDAAGNLYIADTLNHCIRKVAGGVITTFAGTGEQGYAGDGGQAAVAQLDSPTGVSADPTVTGRVWVGDTHNQRLRVVDATGVISTAAGNGVLGFGGDGGNGTAGLLAFPKGVSVGADGTVYVADSGNQRIRAVSGTAIRTFAGDGEQGFAGDLSAPATAILDTPWAVAVSGAGTVAVADTHNQRIRAVTAVAGATIDTIAGVPPALAEGILVSGPTSGVYGSGVGQLAANFVNGSNLATGTVTLTDGGTPIGSTALLGNAASFDLSGLAGGLHTLVATFGGDTQNPAIASGVYVVNIAAAAQTVSFTGLTTSLTYSPGLTETLAAGASSGLPVVFAVSGPATLSGSTLTITGTGTITVTATQQGNADYAATSTAQQIAVRAAPLSASDLSPTVITLGAPSTTLTVDGSGFTSTSQVELNGTPLQTTFVSFNQLSATLPAVLTTSNLAITVVDPASQSVSATLNLRVTVPTANAVLSVPSQSASGQQPGVSVQLTSAYPVPITGVLTLSFAAANGQTATDPAQLFSNGSQVYPFTIPANTTSTEAVSFSTGTLAGTVTVHLALTAAGVDVTPTAAGAATVAVPAQVPQIASNHVSFVQSGQTLTVTVVGFSNTRDMNQALFTFSPASGSSLATSSLTVPVNSLFSNWFGSSTSATDGSNFTYTQTFTLSDPDTVISGVNVQLVNSVGTSATAASQ